MQNRLYVRLSPRLYYRFSILSSEKPRQNPQALTS
jgi:hypothetical protein